MKPLSIPPTQTADAPGFSLATLRVTGKAAPPMTEPEASPAPRWPWLDRWFEPPWRALLTWVGLAWLMGGSKDTLISLAPKSVTAPVAMGITQQLGGLPSLTAVLVILTGILGAMIGPILLDWFGITDQKARGVSLGTASHGIGTAQAMQASEVAGAFSGLAMGLNALATAILLPILWRLVFGG